MAVRTEVTRKLDNNCVQVEVYSNKIPTRYFKVPEAQADSFCSSFKKNDKKMKRFANTTFFLSIIGACGIVSLLTKKLGSTARLAIGVLGGMAGAAGSMYATAPTIEKNEDRVLKKHHAQQIFYDDKKFPI